MDFTARIVDLRIRHERCEIGDDDLQRFLAEIEEERAEEERLLSLYDEEPPTPAISAKPREYNGFILHFTALKEMSYDLGRRNSLEAVLSRGDAVDLLGGRSKFSKAKKTLKDIPFNLRVYHDTACRTCPHNTAACTMRYSYNNQKKHEQFCLKILSYGLENWRDDCDESLEDGVFWECSELIGK